MILKSYINNRALIICGSWVLITTNLKNICKNLGVSTRKESALNVICFLLLSQLIYVCMSLNSNRNIQNARCKNRK